MGRRFRSPRLYGYKFPTSVKKVSVKLHAAFAFQHDRCIFPVSVFLNGVDVFICQIDTSGKSHLSINDRYFSVISVILLYGQNRSEGIEYGALDTVIFLAALRSLSEE